MRSDKNEGNTDASQTEPCTTSSFLGRDDRATTLLWHKTRSWSSDQCHDRSWVCVALIWCNILFLYRCRSGAQALTGHMHNLGRNVARALAVASLASALVGRWSVPVSEPHCVRERESDFERLVGQNLWGLESLVKQVGDCASSGKADTVPLR